MIIFQRYIDYSFKEGFGAVGFSANSIFHLASIMQKNNLKRLLNIGINKYIINNLIELSKHSI